MRRHFHLIQYVKLFQETGTKLLEVIEKLDSAKKEGLKVIGNYHLYT